MAGNGPKRSTQQFPMGGLYYIRYQEIFLRLLGVYNSNERRLASLLFLASRDVLRDHLLVQILQFGLFAKYDVRYRHWCHQQR